MERNGRSIFREIACESDSGYFDGDNLVCMLRRALGLFKNVPSHVYPSSVS